MGVASFGTVSRDLNRRINPKMKHTTKLRSLLFAFIALFALVAGPAAAKKSASGFSFAVYGDARSMMYLPYNLDQKEEATNTMVDMFELVLPEKVAAEVVKKDVKLIYDPATKELAQVIMPFMTHSEVTYMTLDKGWVTEAA